MSKQLREGGGTLWRAFLYGGEKTKRVILGTTRVDHSK